MLEMGPEIITVIMFSGVLGCILLGYPIGFVLAGISVIVGILTEGLRVFNMFQLGVHSVMTNYVLLAVPLFVFMGNMIQKTGITKKMFEAMYVWLGGLRGGLAIVTIIIGAILAACTGVIAASVVMLGLISLPEMLNRGYDKKIACGAICAGGSLGILIPPSVMIVVYGPTASLSVGKLFAAAFMPGILLAVLYIGYIGIKCRLSPELGPAVSIEERQRPLKEKVNMLVKSLLPPVILVLAVLGSIIAGIASPTEAAGIGALASIVMAAGYKVLNWENVKDSLLGTLKLSAMVHMVAWGAKMFTVLYLRLGCGEVISNLITSVPFGRWGSFAVIMIVLFILGMFVDWLGIVFIMVPIITPIGKELGFDPIWFAMMMMINLQLSFITPPFAYAIFYLKSILKKEWGVATGDIIKGIVPYLGLICLAIILCIFFPQIILWLPNNLF